MEVSEVHAHTDTVGVNTKEISLLVKQLCFETDLVTLSILVKVHCFTL